MMSPRITNHWTGLTCQFSCQLSVSSDLGNMDGRAPLYTYGYMLWEGVWFTHYLRPHSIHVHVHVHVQHTCTRTAYMCMYIHCICLVHEFAGLDSCHKIQPWPCPICTGEKTWVGVLLIIRFHQLQVDGFSLNDRWKTTVSTHQSQLSYVLTYFRCKFFIILSISVLKVLWKEL